MLAALLPVLAFSHDGVYRCGNDFSDHSSISGKGECKVIGHTASRQQYVALADSQSIRVGGTVNDHAIEFLVDTGASDVVVSPEFAKKAGISGGKRIHVVTANGDLHA